jgi:hypothetical protein
MSRKITVGLPLLIFDTPHNAGAREHISAALALLDLVRPDGLEPPTPWAANFWSIIDESDIDA